MEEKQDVFTAIADRTRRQILRLLTTERELALHEIVPHFDMGRTAVSKHLSVLKAADLVHSRKVGRETRYRMDPMPLQEVTDWLAFYESFWQERLVQLDDVLKQHNEEEK